MFKMDYLEIVLNGFINNREYLDKYFIRKFKEAESKNYVFGEFFKCCLNVVAALDKELKKQYFDDKKESQEGLQGAISTGDKDAEDIFREQLNELNDLKECNYSVNLYQFTKGKFTGDLDCEDLSHIALSIGLAIKTINEQTPATSLEPEPPGTIENPHPRIFPNGKCWQLFEHWRNEVKERTQLAEFSFIFWQMQKDGLIHENIKPTEFRNWMLKTFSINLEPLKQLTVCNGGNKYSRYQSAKLLFKC